MPVSVTDNNIAKLTVTLMQHARTSRNFVREQFTKFMAFRTVNAVHFLLAIKDWRELLPSILEHKIEELDRWNAVNEILTQSEEPDKKVRINFESKSESKVTRTFLAWV